MSKRTQIIIIVIGIVLVCIGVFMPIPSKELSTYSFMAEEGYSVIEEYVGGDAYNFIIGASLVGGEISGAKAQKAIYTVAGLFFICAGMVISDIQAKAKLPAEKPMNKEYDTASEDNGDAGVSLAQNIDSDIPRVEGE